MKTSQYFDERSAEWSEHYSHDPRFRRRFERIVALLARMLPPTSGRVLDAGCGSGVFSRYLASLGWQVTAIDASAEMIETARNATANAEQITYEVSTIEQFSAEPNSFDAIVSFSMLEYLEEDHKAIAKLAKMLRPNGVLVVSVPNRSGMLRKLEGLIFGIRTASRDRLFPESGEYLKYQKNQYSPFELDLLMRQHGLKKVRGIYLNSGITGPAWLLPILEQRWWAAMYCAAYRKA